MATPKEITFNLAVGRSRQEVKWQNKPTTWGAFLHKIETTTRTAETLAEYAAATKARQSEIKDVGGYVGGYLNEGKRKNGYVRSRQLLTLDIDYGTPNVWDDFTRLYGCAAAVYSTHKHTAEKPRLRLVVPLNREVLPWEYEAVARRVAGDVGINLFDDSTFEPTRLMYWPSTSKDGDYYYHHQDGEPLDADEVLARYTNAADASEWPVSDRVGAAVMREAKNAGDPTEKDNIVGTFCREYTLTEAIEKFLPDVYAPTDHADRWTYKEGSTAGGLVVYDDKWAYSHHGTDPCGGMLCNAFDLVRLHKFGAMDEGASPTTRVDRRPSYSEMCKFCAADKATWLRRMREKTDAARADFNGVEVEDDGEWMAELTKTAKGLVENTANNAARIFNNDPKLKDRIWCDTFLNQISITAPLPWRTPTNAADAAWTDEDDANLRGYIEAEPYNISARQKTDDGFAMMLTRHTRDCVREYMDGLTWDGTPRVETLLVDTLGADDNRLNRLFTRKALTAAVARTYEPGMKFDYVLTLVGGQGIGKSTLAAKLGRQWFNATFSFTDKGKSMEEQVRGSLVVEISELQGAKRAEVEAAKAFISNQIDRYRPAYGRRVMAYPRRCIFIATTNEDTFLRDGTGNRRWWVVRCNAAHAKRHPATLTEEEVGQIWAEAKHYYNEGETLYLEPKDEKLAAEVQRGATEAAGDERRGLISEYLNTLLPSDWYGRSIESRRAWLRDREDDPTAAVGVMQRKTVCVAEIVCECLGTPRTMIRDQSFAVNKIMRTFTEWEEKGNTTKWIKPYGAQRYFELKEEEEDL